MILLTVDTATPVCCVGLVDAGQTLAEMVQAAGTTHSRHLMEMIRSVLSIADLKLADVDGFAVAVGPGSFTGIRIGISTVNGLAVATGKPAAGVCTLDALAQQAADTDGLVCPMIDARKGEVYFGLYRVNGGECNREMPPRVLPPEAVIDLIHEPARFVGDGALACRDLIEARLGSNASLAPAALHRTRAETLARCAEAEASPTGVWSGSGVLSPLYVRKPDAEINRERREQGVHAPGSGGDGSAMNRTTE